MTLPRLYTLPEVLETVPVSDRKLRDIVKEIGLEPAPGCGKYAFTLSQVTEIQGRIACRSNSTSQEPGTGTRSITQQFPSKGEGLKSARGRQTRALLAASRSKESGNGMNITSLAEARKPCPAS